MATTPITPTQAKRSSNPPSPTLDYLALPYTTTIPCLHTRGRDIYTSPSAFLSSIPRSPRGLDQFAFFAHVFRIPEMVVVEDTTYGPTLSAFGWSLTLGWRRLRFDVMSEEDQDVLRAHVDAVKKGGDGVEGGKELVDRLFTSRYLCDESLLYTFSHFLTPPFTLYARIPWGSPAHAQLVQEFGKPVEIQRVASRNLTPTRTVKITLMEGKPKPPSSADGRSSSASSPASYPRVAAVYSKNDLVPPGRITRFALARAWARADAMMRRTEVHTDLATLRSSQPSVVPDTADRMALLGTFGERMGDGMREMWKRQCAVLSFVGHSFIHGTLFWNTIAHLPHFPVMVYTQAHYFVSSISSTLSSLPQISVSFTVDRGGDGGGDGGGGDDGGDDGGEEDGGDDGGDGGDGGDDK